LKLLYFTLVSVVMNPSVLTLAVLLLNLLGCGNATAAGPVSSDLNPFTPVDNNRLWALNRAVHQEWYFNSFSFNGTSDITIVFFHQPSFLEGELSVMLDVV
jgi:hypothetical protein